jgi:hypothetical protein
LGSYIVCDTRYGREGGRDMDMDEDAYHGSEEDRDELAI